MKLVLFCLFTAKKIQAQEIDIIGTWTMFEMIWTSVEEANKTTEDQLKDEVIHLKRSSPDGSSSVVNSFKRK